MVRNDVKVDYILNGTYKKSSQYTFLLHHILKMNTWFVFLFWLLQEIIFQFFFFKKRYERIISGYV